MIYDLNSPSLHHGELKDDMYEFMQFTGLHDRNGKEIYEGDIVLMKFEYSKIEYKYEVKWIESKSSFYPFADDFQWSDYESAFDNNSVRSLEVEVIGNIYENRELLHENP